MTYNLTFGPMFVEDSETDYKGDLVSEMMSVLDDRERSIIEMSFGIGNSSEMPLIEIGKSLGLSCERVRQIRKTSINKMRSIAMLSQAASYMLE